LIQRSRRDMNGRLKFANVICFKPDFQWETSLLDGHPLGQSHLLDGRDSRRRLIAF
jgi:hypothetical protein